MVIFRMFPVRLPVSRTVPRRGGQRRAWDFQATFLIALQLVPASFHVAPAVFCHFFYFWPSKVLQATPGHFLPEGKTPFSSLLSPRPLHTALLLSERARLPQAQHPPLVCGRRLGAPQFNSALTSSTRRCHRTWQVRARPAGLPTPGCHCASDGL